MKRKSAALVGSDDKKARWEAGLDIDLSKDWEDLQVRCSVLRFRTMFFRILPCVDFGSTRNFDQKWLKNPLVFMSLKVPSGQNRESSL
jgi:hypothetical protein